MSLEQAIQNLADAINSLAGAKIGVAHVAPEKVEAVKAAAAPAKAKAKAAPVKAAPPAEDTEDDNLDEETTEDAEDAPTAEDYVVALQTTHRRLIAIATEKGELLPVAWSKGQLAKVTGGLKKDEVDPADYAKFIAGFAKLK